HYTATAQLLLGVSSVGAATESAALAESQIEALKSSRLAQSVIDKRGLWKDPEFACGPRGPLRRVLYFTRDACAVSPMVAVHRDTTVANFKDPTTVARSGHSFVVNVSFTS